MVDFTSALYLGLRHPSAVLQPWRELTTGVPAALHEPVEARAIALTLARLQGFAAGALAPSTLHLAWDIFGLLNRERITVHLDAGAYPISRWGAALRGMKVRTFPHQDARTLHRHVQDDPAGIRPVVLTDGFCPACGRRAPLAEYLASVRSRGGRLIVDDTQAIGILGRDPHPESPYGRGGGGSFRWQRVHGPEVIVIASLAKAFGVPVAAVCGSGEFIEQFRTESDTRVHCSPPSAADLAAATHALEQNRSCGDDRRGRLVARVRQFRRGLAAMDIVPSGGLFPVQTLRVPRGVSASSLHHRLRQRGVSAALLRGEDQSPRLGFLIRADHSEEQIERAVADIGEAVSSSGSAFFNPTERAAFESFVSLHHHN